MAIIDRQLPFENTITSRSTDVVVMALVLRVEKKMYVIEQPLPVAPAVDSEAQVQFENSSPYNMIKELKAMFEKQARVERFDLIQTFHACKQEEGKPVAAYVIQTKGYVDQLERLGYVLPQDLIVGKGKANGKGRDKQFYIPKPKNPKPSTKEHPAKDDACHHCKEVGHWKRNYNVYLAKLLKKKKQVGSASFSEQCSLFNVIPSNGIYEIDMHDLVPNVNSIYNVSTKRAKHNLDSTYLWHCRLAHISKKRIEKLQQEGLLKSTYDESFDQCVSCLSGKMTRKSFPHRPERATDLLGIIHTDVCGPLRHVSRQGASYFITFTDDYSRYGYVYLLKHKHEVFETFKVFKNEVENQLGKTSKALRSNRGGEYISQEFKDYLKACGIAQQLTPPYSPQHNGVSERRNRTFVSHGSINDKSYNYVVILLGLCYRVCNTHSHYGSNQEEKSHNSRSQWEAIDLEEIQDDDTRPSKITSEIPIKVEGFEPPQEEVIMVRRSERTHRAPDRLCLNVEEEEHSLGDLNEPTSYKAAMLDSESNKWIDAMNAKI
ncbi:retrotransposon protein, putative, ty1-copia subclass [Tanacetum coccineum]